MKTFCIYKYGRYMGRIDAETPLQAIIAFAATHHVNYLLLSTREAQS